MKKILLAGEGTNELGDWGKEEAYQRPEAGPRGRRTAPHRAGVLEALLRKQHPDGWEIRGGILWKSIVKIRAGNHRAPEVRNVLGLINEAHERKCDVVAFTRDRDGANAAGKQREKDVEEGLREAGQLYPDGPAVVGGMAVERIESWVAALLGHARSEALGDDKIDEILKKHGIEAKNTEHLRTAVEGADLEKIPGDAASLGAWLQRADGVFGGETR